MPVSFSLQFPFHCQFINTLPTEMITIILNILNILFFFCRRPRECIHVQSVARLFDRRETCELIFILTQKRELSNVKYVQSDSFACLSCMSLHIQTLVLQIFLLSWPGSFSSALLGLISFHLYFFHIKFLFILPLQLNCSFLNLYWCYFVFLCWRYSIFSVILLFPWSLYAVPTSLVYLIDLIMKFAPDWMLCCLICI